MRSLQKTVAKLLNTIEPHLKGISNEIDKRMERIASRREPVQPSHRFYQFLFTSKLSLQGKAFQQPTAIYTHKILPC